MTPDPSDDQALLDRLADDLPEDELLGLCARLADRLLREGFTAEASRWRTLSLVPTSVADRQEPLDQARRRLAGPAPTAVLEALTVHDLSPAWRDLLQHLRLQRQAPLPPDLLPAVLAAEPPPEPVQLGMADLCLGLDHDAIAERLLRRLVGDSGLAPAACNRLGVTAFRRGDPWYAERWFRTSLQQDQAQAVVWFELARVLRLQRQHDEALEAAEAGLGFAPGHPWGLKLRARILLEVGGWDTLQALETHDALPDDDELRPAWQATPLPRLQAWGRPRPPAPGLAQRLALRQRLQALDRVEVLFGRGLGPLLWARAHDLLPAGLPVQPWASRDPVGVRQRLEAAGFQPEPERGLWSAESTPPQVTARSLVLLERPRDRLLPVALASHWLQGGWLAQPQGLTWPQGPVDAVLRQQGWELLAPAPDA